MQSKAATADAYVAEAPAERRAALERIRQIARERLPGYDETMRYGMITYERAGVGEVSLASQKQYIAVHFMGGDVFERAGARMAGHDYGKGCLRFRRIEAIDYDLLSGLMADRAAAAPGGY